MQAKIQKDLDTPDQNHRYALVNRLCSIYRTAKDKKFAGRGRRPAAVRLRAPA